MKRFSVTLELTADFSDKELTFIDPESWAKTLLGEIARGWDCEPVSVTLDEIKDDEII